MKIKNPRHAPHNTEPIVAISVTLYFAAITERHAIIIIDIDAPSPSIPSVKLIAFVAASITNITNGIYNKAGNIISFFNPGIIVPVPIPTLIKYNAYIIDIISKPDYFVNRF